MSRMLLTAVERQRFADYLDLEAESSELLAVQMDKLPGPALAALAKQHRFEAHAARTIAKRLRAIEDFEVGR